jgi:hypothetical protein
MEWKNGMEKDVKKISKDKDKFGYKKNDDCMKNLLFGAM